MPLEECTPQADKLDEVVDYDFMRNTVAARMAQGHVHLQETLCDDVARAIAFLVDERNDWITGHVLVVDGGLTA